MNAINAAILLLLLSLSVSMVLADENRQFFQELDAGPVSSLPSSPDMAPIIYLAGAIIAIVIWTYERK